MNTQRDIKKTTHPLRESVEYKRSTHRFPKQDFIVDPLHYKEGKKMKVTKALVSLIGVCLIPITGLVFMERADAYQIQVMKGNGKWPTKPAQGKCTTVINVSSSGRDTWYWEVECGRNASRKEYLKAKTACSSEFETKSNDDRYEKLDSLIPPYQVNKCY